MLERQVAAALAALAAGDGPFLMQDDFTQADFRGAKSQRDDARPGFNDRPSFNDRPRSFGGDDRREPRHLPRERPARQSDGYGPTETFRIEVGRVDGVKPGNIVGAIANEAGVDGACIGRIEIFDRHSHLDMPAGMPEQVFQSLQQVVVAGRALNISVVADGGDRPNFARPEYPTKRRFEKPAARFSEQGPPPARFSEQGPPRFSEKKKFGARAKFGDKPKFGKPSFGDKPKFGAKSKFAAKPKYAKRSEEGSAPAATPAAPVKPGLNGKFKTKTKARPKPLKRTKSKS